MSDEHVFNEGTLFEERVKISTPSRFVHADDTTSYEAAKSSPVKRDSERHRLLVAFKEHGAMTDQEAGELAHVTGEYDDRRHCTVLRTDGYLEMIEERGLSKRGKPCMKSVITQKGLWCLREVKHNER